MKYLVLSQRVGRFDAGAIVNADDLAGCNIGALVAGGHVRPVNDEPAADNIESESE